jgi:hypothetical protein
VDHYFRKLTEEMESVQHKYVAMYYGNERKEVTFGIYGIFDDVESAEKYLKESAIKLEENGTVVEVDKHGLPIDEKFRGRVEDYYVCMTDCAYCGKFVKGFIQMCHGYYISDTYIIVEVKLF